MENIKNQTPTYEVQELVDALCEKEIDATKVAKLAKDAFEVFKTCDGFDQKNRAHHLDLLSHTIEVVKNVPPHKVVRIAALFHDVGKIEAQKLGSDGYCHYHNHQAFSIKIFLDNLLKYEYIEAGIITKDEISEIMIMILFHDENISNDVEVYKALTSYAGFGMKNLNDFLALQLADLKAHAPWYYEKKAEFLKKEHARCLELAEQI